MFPGIVTAIFYWVACAPYAAVDALSSASFRGRHKLQPDKAQRPDAWAHALGLTLWHHVAFILPGLATQAHTRGPWQIILIIIPSKRSVVSSEVCRVRSRRTLFPARFFIDILLDYTHMILTTEGLGHPQLGAQYKTPILEYEVKNERLAPPFFETLTVHCF